MPSGGTRRGPFNNTSMGVNSSSFGPPHVHAPWCVRVVPDRLTKSRKTPTRKTLPLFENITALCGEQDPRYNYSATDHHKLIAVQPILSDQDAQGIDAEYVIVE